VNVQLSLTCHVVSIMCGALPLRRRLSIQPYDTATISVGAAAGVLSIANPLVHLTPSTVAT